MTYCFFRDYCRMRFPPNGGQVFKQRDSDRVVRVYHIGELHDQRPYFVMT